MKSAPPEFRAQLRSHNRHAMLAAVLSAIAAIVLWNVAYFVFVLVLLGLTTAAKGDWGPEMPMWIPATAFGLALALLVWGIVDHIRRRFKPTSDRPIIGWHLFGEFLLLPVRLLFSTWGNFGAVRRLNPAEQSAAWQLLTTIHQVGKARIGSLALFEPDVARLHKLLGTLQLLGYIDLHRGEEDWFYTVRSTREPELRALENS